MSVPEFLEKYEVEDENKVKRWEYRCKTCQAVHMTIPLWMLAFAQEYENNVSKQSEPDTKKV